MERLGRHPWLFWLDLVLKAALVGLLAFGAFSGLQQFEGKAFAWRLAAYPPCTLIIPVGWALLARRSAYPYLADILLTLPFFIDTWRQRAGPLRHH